MRYPSDHKAKTRQTIIGAAARVWRREGYHGGGVDAVMAEAGLTVGGFYSHFKSKEDLLTELLRTFPEAIKDIIPDEFKDLEGLEWVYQHVDHYLSKEHRDAKESGCPIPSLVAEIERRNDSCREVFSMIVEHWVGEFTKHLMELPIGEGQRIDLARSMFLIGIGTASTARALGATPASDALLASSRRTARQLVAAAGIA